MKKIIVLGTMLLISSMAFAQTELMQAKLKKGEVPEKVIQSLQRDFPEDIVKSYFGVPVELVGDALFWHTNKNVDDHDFDIYSISLKSKNADFNATYDKQGKLLSKYEMLKDKALPTQVLASIAKDFAGWIIGNDKMILTAYKDQQEKVHYKVKLTQGNMHNWVVFDQEGTLLKGGDHDMSKMHHKKNLEN